VARLSSWPDRCDFDDLSSREQLQLELIIEEVGRPVS
jgi:hypothetical protein